MSIEASVRLSELSRERINAVRLRETELVVVHDGTVYRVYYERCPHLGGPLSRGAFCSKSKSLSCPWHGYSFRAADGQLQCNPNEERWTRPMAGERFEEYRTPGFKLREVPSRVEGEYLMIELKS